LQKRKVRQGLALLGVNDLRLGGFDTFQAAFDENLNASILSVLESRRYGCVYTHWFGDAHHDHRSVARSTMHCCRHVGRILMYRSNWYATEAPFHPTFFIDISEHLELKLAAIAAHESEVGRVGGRWLTYARNEAENRGMQIGVDAAEAFEVVRWVI
jgi:LmbE family N-acetylglucosaminyl deacetylase